MNQPHLADILDNLLNQLDPQVAALNSFTHFHTRGLVYLNLHRSSDLTAKLYLIDPAVVQHQPSGYLVNPHDHAYRFHTLVAAGECTNYTFKTDEWIDWHHHEFHSAMNGPSKIVSRGTCGLVPMSNQIMQPGEGYYCDERTIHTISTHPRKTTVLFLLQYRDIRTPTNLYTRERTPPSLDGLYKRMTPEKVGHFANLARVLIDDAKRGG